MRATGSFTIKQCNRVADAWSVVCGPRAPVPPLSFHSFHCSTTTPWRCPHHLEVLFGAASFLLSFPFAHPASPRLFTFCARPEDGDSSTYWLLRPFGNSASLIVPDCHNWISRGNDTRRVSDIDKKFFTKWRPSLKVKWSRWKLAPMEAQQHVVVSIEPLDGMVCDTSKLLSAWQRKEKFYRSFIFPT